MQTSEEAARPCAAPRRRGPRPTVAKTLQTEIRARPEAALSRPRQATVVALHNALRRMEAARDGAVSRASVAATEG